MSAETLRFGWWNTGLVPRSTYEPREARTSLAEAVVKRLLVDEKVDLLTLGEVNPPTTDRFRQSCADLLDLRVFVEEEARLGVALLYDRTKVQIEDCVSVFTFTFGQRRDAAWRFNLRVGAARTPMDLYVVHWPSRMVDAQRTVRKRLGDQIRDDARGRDATRGSRFALVIGDFNDEPFDESVAFGLESTRDRWLARQRKELFYNPSWRLLGHPTPHRVGAVSEPAPAGSYYFKSPHSTRWLSFDQLLVSAEFLDGEWQLDESKVSIWGTDLLLGEKGAMQQKFDHLPMLGEIARCVRMQTDGGSSDG